MWGVSPGRGQGTPGVRKAPHPSKWLSMRMKVFQYFNNWNSQAGVYPLNVSSALFRMLSFLCTVRQTKMPAREQKMNPPTPAAPGDLTAPTPPSQVCLTPGPPPQASRGIGKEQAPFQTLTSCWPSNPQAREGAMMSLSLCFRKAIIRPRRGSAFKAEGQTVYLGKGL